MLTREEISKRFATTDKEGSASSMFIYGDTIYSYGYHFPIARKTGKLDSAGRPIALFTCRGYSMTTAHHKSYVYRALLEAGYRIIVTDISEVRVSESALNFLKKEIEEAQQKALRARKEDMHEYWKNQEARSRADIATLQSAFNL